MRFVSSALYASTLFAASAEARFLIYADEWHPTRPTNPEDRAGIDHVVLAFAMANGTATFQPKVPISTIRSEYPNAKVMIAVGGWGDDIGYFEASKTDATIQKFAADVATMLTNTGADGLDIDWEYPGGNGADYKQVPNAEKAYQIEAYPKTLAAVRTAIGDKLLSIAVPGKKGDMIAFTAETGPKIWPSVDYINVMSYDLMNRRDNATKHHTSVAGSEDTIRNYLEIGAPPEKINLGFAYYAKYFTTAGDCSSSPLDCPIVLAEDPVTGKDLLTSGAWTFEKFHLSPVDTSSLQVSYDGTCGPEKGTKCSSGCCSQYGNCGSSPEHCSGACQHAFGIGCTDADVAGSWQLAAQHGITDEQAGGEYYFDAQNRLFWTWDTPALITRKFDQIVRQYGLGGVMAWSLGEDNYDWSHVRQMAAELAKTGGESDGEQPSAHGTRPMQPAPALEETPTPPTPPHPSTSPPHDVVWVDGTSQGPESETLTDPGSPPDLSVNYEDDVGADDDEDEDDDIGDILPVGPPTFTDPRPRPPAPNANPYTPPTEPTEPIAPIAPTELPFFSPIPMLLAPPASTPIVPLTMPFAPDFVPDPGYVNPNWHPDVAAAAAPAAVAVPAAESKGVAVPVRQESAFGEGEERDAGGRMSIGGACRMRRRRVRVRRT